jgi:orotate phosphoribosyltransferase
MLAIFTYGFGKATDAFSDISCRLDTLSDYGALVELALESGYVTEEDLVTLRQWRVDPSKWGV